MIAKIALLLLTTFFGSGLTAVSTIKSVDEVIVKEVENLEDISVADYNDLYLGAIFYQRIDESKIEYSSQNVLSVSKYDETIEVEEVDINGKLLGKYFYETEKIVL